VAYNAYARAWPASLLALFSSFGVHFASFFLFCCAARALSIHSGGPNGPEISFGALLSVMPIILTLCALPISVGGTGVREVLFINLLGPLCNVAQPEAIMLSLTGFMLTSAWGMVGGLIYLLYRPSQHKFPQGDGGVGSVPQPDLPVLPSEHVKFPEIERQVLEFEHEIAVAEVEDKEDHEKKG
jgi:hypothetical protein